MDNALLFLKDNAVAVGIVLTIVGLIGGAIGASVRFLIDSKKIENEKKAVRQQMITNNIAPMRQAWINDVRSRISDITGDFHLVLYCLLSYTENENLYKKLKPHTDEIVLKFQYKIQHLKLLLPNPKKDEKSKKINILIDELMEITYLPPSDLDKNVIDSKLLELSKFTQELLKQEWEVTKSLKEIE